MASYSEALKQEQKDRDAQAKKSYASKKHSKNRKDQLQEQINSGLGYKELMASKYWNYKMRTFGSDRMIAEAKANDVKKQREKNYKTLLGKASQEFKYGGLTEDQQAHLDLTKQNTLQQRSQDQRAMMSKMGAMGVGGGQAGRQLTGLYGNYAKQMQQQEMGYRGQMANDAYGRFRETQGLEYQTMGRKLGWDTSALNNMWQQQSALQNQQFQAQQAQLNREAQQKMADSQKPGALDYVIGGLGAGGKVLGGIGSIIGGK